MSDTRKLSSGENFAVGHRVRVGRGVTDPDFPDLPLGGWAGTVTKVDFRSSPPTYLVRWSSATLSSIHPIFRKRSERDDFEIEELWLAQDDLEPDDGTAADIEQPMAIVTKPLSMNDQDDRIRAVLGLTSDDPLTFVDDDGTLVAFHEHLSGNLKFPIQASWKPENSPSQQVSIIGLSDADEDLWAEGMCGLLCRAKLKDELIEVSLADCEAQAGSTGQQLLADYGYWFRNWR